MLWFIVGLIIGTVNGMVLASLAVAAHKGDQQTIPEKQKDAVEEDFWKEGDDGTSMVERRE